MPDVSQQQQQQQHKINPKNPRQIKFGGIFMVEAKLNCIRQRLSATLSWSEVQQESASSINSARPLSMRCDAINFSGGNISHLTECALGCLSRGTRWIHGSCQNWHIHEAKTGWREMPLMGIEANPFDIKRTIGNSTFPFCQLAVFFLLSALFPFFISLCFDVRCCYGSWIVNTVC